MIPIVVAAVASIIVFVPFTSSMFHHVISPGITRSGTTVGLSNNNKIIAGSNMMTATHYSLKRVWSMNLSGNGQFNVPAGVAVDHAGNVYVADSGNNRIQKFDSIGKFIATWGSSGSGNG